MIERRRDCRSELVARARRERLSQAENLALQAHLAGCAPCRLSRNVFSDFSEMSTIDHRDDARIEDLSALARRWTQGRVRPRRRRGTGRARLRFMAFAAGLALLAGTASAAIWIRRRTAEAPATPAAARAIPERAPTRRTAAQIGVSGSSGAPGSSGSPLGATAAMSAPAAMSPPAPAATSPEARVAPPPPRRRDLRVASQSSGPAAALLLRRAGEAQRDGEREKALTLYRQLRRGYATSPEALLATVALGRLLLDRAPAAARAEFDAYLRASPAGALVPEALYGRARALGRLGDDDAEKQTWQRLLGGFPDSAYAPVGRRRLAELR